MKAFLSPSIPLFLIFAPALLLASMDEVSVETICREATTGYNRHFCLSALNDIPLNQTEDIREFAVAAIRQLITYYPHSQLDDGEMAPDYEAFRCVKSMARAITNLDDAETMIKRRDCNGAAKKIFGATTMLNKCKKFLLL